MPRPARASGYLTDYPGSLLLNMKLLLSVTPITLGIAAAFAAPAEAIDQSRVARLSDERKVTRWAHPEWRAPVRPRPDGMSPTKARLRYDTEDGLQEVYVALRSYRHPDGSEWVQIRLPRRPNGQKGWVRREALGPFRVVRTRLVIDRTRLRATLYRNGRRVWRASVGVGAPGTPTPAGNFYIRGRLRPPPGGLYGDFAFPTSAYSSLSDWPGGGVVGIHGTNQPHLIPGRPSHGCIRVKNPDIRRLAKLMPNGTPVRII